VNNFVRDIIATISVDAEPIQDNGSTALNKLDRRLAGLGAGLSGSKTVMKIRPGDCCVWDGNPRDVGRLSSDNCRTLIDAVVTRSTGLAAPVRDAMGEATHQLIAELAASCRSELRTITRADDPVRYRLILDRDMV